MKLDKHIQNIYFIGIGGIGMSALARYFMMNGKQVYGYDKTPSELTKALAAEGVTITYEDQVTPVETSFAKETTLIVYTPAIPLESVFLKYFKTNGYPIVKRSELLGEITKTGKCLAVAGTHGKTTTSAMLAHLMAETNQKVTAFLGGIAENYQSNIILKGQDYTVVEADEFDRSFLKLNPFVAGITSMDADHLDIYGDEATIKLAFTEFASLVPSDGFLLHKKGLPLNGLTVAVEEEADFEAQNVRINKGAYVFDFKSPKVTVKNITLNLPGRHNLFNATLALGMAVCSGLPINSLPKALLNFKGVKRRFSYKLKTPNCVLIDDYAHHPEEINAVHLAVTEMYPDQDTLVVFQPHLFSRTKDFGDAFAESLSKFDKVFLMEIYPAREKPIDGINAQWLLDKINNNNKELISKEALPNAVKNSKIPVVVMLGAGDIGEEVNKVKTALSNEN